MAMLSTELDCLELGCGRKVQRFAAHDIEVIESCKQSLIRHSAESSKHKHADRNVDNKDRSHEVSDVE